MEQAVYHFHYKGNPVSCERYGQGHINRTFLVETDTGNQYILQCISSRAFHDIPGLMENALAVTEHIAKKNPDERGTLKYVRADSGDLCYVDEKGEYWRSYIFVDDCICLQLPECEEDFYQSAAAFGEFQNQLADFPADTLHETIPHFHDTPDRYRKFRKSLEKDVMHRAADAENEIKFVLEHEKEAGYLMDLLAKGELPLRVTHNDTKINNVLLDAKTRKPLCVIDLDTVMPGLTAFDFGDSIRSGATTGAEDETDLSKVNFDMNLYRIFAGGFIRACPNLTEKEKEVLPWGAKMMTLECGVRFLTDFLDGDVYFATAREAHNLDRARTQFKLVSDMENHWDEMNRIIQEESEKNRE